MKLKFFMVTKQMVDWLRGTREKLGLRQGEVAEACKLGQSDLSAIEVGKAKRIRVTTWATLVKFYAAKKATPLAAEHDPLQSAPNPGDLLTRVKAVKKTTGSSWEAVADTLGVKRVNLLALLSDRPPGHEILLNIKQGLDRLEGLPKKMADAGAVSPPKEVMPALKKRKEGKPAITKPLIQHVTVMPTLTALKLRELELLRSLQKDIETHQLGDILNGSALKFLNG